MWMCILHILSCTVSLSPTIPVNFSFNIRDHVKHQAWANRMEVAPLIIVKVHLFLILTQMGYSERWKNFSALMYHDSGGWGEFYI